MTGGEKSDLISQGLSSIYFTPNEETRPITEWVSPSIVRQTQELVLVGSNCA